MKGKIPKPPVAGVEVESERDKLIRLLSALMARRWWREQNQNSKGETKLAEPSAPRVENENG